MKPLTISGNAWTITDPIKLHTTGDCRLWSFRYWLHFSRIRIVLPSKVSELDAFAHLLELVKLRERIESKTFQNAAITKLWESKSGHCPHEIATALDLIFRSFQKGHPMRALIASHIACRVYDGDEVRSIAQQLRREFEAYDDLVERIFKLVAHLVRYNEQEPKCEEAFI